MRPTISEILAAMQNVLKAGDFTVEIDGTNLGLLSTDLEIKHSKAGRKLVITFVATVDSICELEDMPGRSLFITVKRVDLPTIEASFVCESSTTYYSYGTEDVARVVAEFVG